MANRPQLHLAAVDDSLLERSMNVRMPLLKDCSINLRTRASLQQRAHCALELTGRPQHRLHAWMHQMRVCFVLVACGSCQDWLL